MVFRGIWLMMAMVACTGDTEPPPGPLVAPTVAFLAPEQGVTVVSDEALTVTVEVVDPDTEDLTQVSLDWFGAAEGQGPAAPGPDGRATFDVTGFSAGVRSITVRALDPDGIAASASLSFEVTPAPVDSDNDGFLDDVDCDDTDADVFPGATEVCDGVDQDCDDEIDEGLTTTGYRDADNDGYGDPNNALEFCEGIGEGYLADASDCDDTLDTINPEALEVCDLVDNNCDMNVDEGVQSDFWFDNDGDGFGDAAIMVQACEAPLMHVDNDLDCNDSDPFININGILEATPFDGQTGVPNDADLTVVLEVFDPLATLTVQGPAGVVPGTLGGLGQVLIFEPDAPLDPLTTYTIDVTWQCGGDQLTFDAGDFLSAVDPALLVAESFRLDILTGNFTQPAGAGPTLVAFAGGPAEVLFGADAAGVDTLDILLAGPDPAGGQDVCVPTVGVDGVDFSMNPNLAYSVPTFEFDVGGVLVRIEDFEFEGIIEANLDSVLGTVRGNIDTRDISIASFGLPNTACLQLALLGFPCNACDDGLVYCIDVVIEDLVGTAEGVGLVPRTEPEILVDPVCNP